MSVAVCRSSFADILMPAGGASSSSSMAWLLPPRQEDSNSDHTSVSLQHEHDKKKADEDDDGRPGELDIWTSIQAKKAAEPAANTPYVHPLLRRSSSSLSQKSLEICTESLGSETGSDAFSSSNEMDSFPFFCNKDDEVRQHNMEEEEEFEDHEKKGEVMKQLTMVNYHCSIGRRSSPARQFPPPLPSISRRDGVPCLSMRPHRRDGRLVVEAVAVPSQNYLHAERQGGRLLLSFINTAASSADIPQPVLQEQLEQQLVESTDQEELVEDEVLVEEEEEEEEVEVVERGTVVEVKVSGGAAAKVHLSTLVINKFVGATPVGNQERWAESEHHHHQNEKQTAANNYSTNETKSVDQCEEQRRATSSTSPLGRIPTTAAAATVAETALSAMGSGDVRDYGRLPRLAAQHAVSPDTKVLFTSKRRNREELLHNMRRCSQLRRPLFIWEPYCIATST